MTTHQVPSPTVIAQFLSLVNNPANQPVYVHCIGGKHRTGVMTAVYRMTMDAWPPARALAEMKQFHFGADFLHPEFKSFVERFVAPRRRVQADCVERHRSGPRAESAREGREEVELTSLSRGAWRSSCTSAGA
jgi:hypothetical protein